MSAKEPSWIPVTMDKDKGLNSVPSPSTKESRVLEARERDLDDAAIGEKRRALKSE